MRGVPSPLKGAVLGLLIERPGHAYELAQRLEGRLGAAWRLATSSVYPVLDQLEGEGLVERMITERPGSPRAPQRVTYRATEAAAKEFDEWMGTPTRKEPVREELYAKLVVGRPDEAGSLLEMLDHYERSCLEMLEAAEPGVNGRARDGWERLLAESIYDAADAHLRAELAWIVSTRRRIREYLAGPDGG